MSKISDWWYIDVYYRVKEVFSSIICFKESISRIFAYLPIIWKSRDWDFDYSLSLFGYSLSRLRKVIENDKNHCHTKKHAKEILTVERLIKRLIENDYIPMEWKKFHDDQGEVRFVEVKEGWYEMVYEGDKVEHSKKLKILSDKEVQLKKRDMELLCKIITRKSRNWWS